MERVTASNYQQAEAFVLKHLKRSGFIYGNLSAESSESYIYTKEDEILAMTNSFNGKYCTYLFPENTEQPVIEQVIKFMRNHGHIGGTVTGAYKQIFEQYYNLPSNCQNEVASLEGLSEPFKLDHRVQYIDSSYFEQYYNSIKTITEFKRDEESTRTSLETSTVVASFKGDMIVSAASLTAISDKTAVVTSVFTHPEYRNQGHAKDCVKQLLNDYADGRTILIFFSNPVAKQLYLHLGFKVEDKLLMFEKPK